MKKIKIEEVKACVFCFHCQLNDYEEKDYECLAGHFDYKEPCEISDGDTYLMALNCGDFVLSEKITDTLEKYVKEA